MKKWASSKCGRSIVVQRKAMCVDTNGNWGKKTETQIMQDIKREQCCRDCRSIVDVEMRSGCTEVRDLIDCAREEDGAVGPWCCVTHNLPHRLRTVSRFGLAKRFSQKVWVEVLTGGEPELRWNNVQSKEDSQQCRPEKEDGGIR